MSGLIELTSDELEEERQQARREAIADFIDRQNEICRKHSSDAIVEDRALAIREFGVEFSIWWPNFKEAPDEIRLAWHERKK